MRLFAWLLAMGILTCLLLWIPVGDLHNGIVAGPSHYLFIYVLLQVLLVLLMDAFATKISLAVTGINQRFTMTFLARGATYLVGVLNYSLGQGALGIYLHRCGVRANQATGALLFMLVMNIGVLIFVASLGLLIGGLPGSIASTISPLGYLAMAGLCSYLVIVAIRPRSLRRVRSLDPIFDAGLRGHMQAAAGRVPHILILVLTHWGAMRLWGIAVPLSMGLALVPVVLIMAALPITPVGLGTTQGIHVLLFSPYVHGVTPESRAAGVLAFSLVYYIFGIAVQVLIGLLCWLRLRRSLS